MQIHKRRSSVIREAKSRVRVSRGRTECQSCRWAPPDGFEWDDMLHGHHCIPIASGGSDDISNIVVLCPTCHALAHRMFGLDGCHPQHLLEHLRRVREEPDVWLYWVRSRT